MPKILQSASLIEIINLYKTIIIVVIIIIQYTNIKTITVNLM